jgi:hypothetical protein
MSGHSPLRSLATVVGLLTIGALLSVAGIVAVLAVSGERDQRAINQSTRSGWRRTVSGNYYDDWGEYRR